MFVLAYSLRTVSGGPLPNTLGQSGRTDNSCYCVRFTTNSRKGTFKMASQERYSALRIASSGGFIGYFHSRFAWEFRPSCRFSTVECGCVACDLQRYPYSFIAPALDDDISAGAVDRCCARLRRKTFSATTLRIQWTPTHVSSFTSHTSCTFCGSYTAFRFAVTTQRATYSTSTFAQTLLFRVGHVYFSSCGTVQYQRQIQRKAGEMRCTFADSSSRH